jgi:hypothetical protein
MLLHVRDLESYGLARDKDVQRDIPAHSALFLGCKQTDNQMARI